MQFSTLLLLSTLSLGAWADPVAKDSRLLGVYIFHLHGHRTFRQPGRPARLTDKGRQLMLASGNDFRKRYLNPSSPDVIHNYPPFLEHEEGFYTQRQVEVYHPPELVYAESAQAFLQGLYPDGDGTGPTASIPYVLDVWGSHPPNVPQMKPTEEEYTIQEAYNCRAAIESSDRYLRTKDYSVESKKAGDFFRSLQPIFHKPLSLEDSYEVYDRLYYYWVHDDLGIQVDDYTMGEAHHHASRYSWSRNYHIKDTSRAIAGKVIAGHILDRLQSTIDANAPKVVVEFGNDAALQALLGLTQIDLTEPDDIDPSFQLLAGSAASITFEVFWEPRDVNGQNDVYVRVWTDKTGTGLHDEQTLFNRDTTYLRWADFKADMSRIAIKSEKEFCTECGGKCRPPFTV